MVSKQIRLSTVEAVKEFTTAMGEFDFPVDLSCGRYTVNGRSIMGIFSLDLSQSITVKAEVHEEQEERFLQVLAKFSL